MQITTSKNKVFSVEFIGALFRDGSRVMIELADERPLAEIAADFDGLESIKAEKEVSKTTAKVYEMYEGYGKLVSIQRNKAVGTVRLTLERSETDV